MLSIFPTSGLLRLQILPPGTPFPQGSVQPAPSHPPAAGQIHLLREAPPDSSLWPMLPHPPTFQITLFCYFYFMTLIGKEQKGIHFGTHDTSVVAETTG